MFPTLRSKRRGSGGRFDVGRSHCGERLFDDGFVSKDVIEVELVELHVTTPLDVEAEVVGDMQHLQRAVGAFEVHRPRHKLAECGLVVQLVHAVLVFHMLDEAGVTPVLAVAYPAIVSALVGPFVVRRVGLFLLDPQGRSRVYPEIIAILKN